MRHLSPLAWVRQKRKERSLFVYLRAARTHEVPHFRKMLFAHLRNTYRTLRAWEAPEEVCYAGLFHSIYGTQILKHQSIPYGKRAEVRALIGERAEQLAYLFSVSDRPEGLLYSLRTRELNTAHGETLPLSSPDISSLLLIECANREDQRGAKSFAKRALEEMRATDFSTAPLTAKILTFLAETSSPIRP